jgi:hypothetical protein
MAKKKEQTVEELIQNIDLSVAQGGAVTHTSSLVGKTFSLNQKKSVIFGVGDIWLDTKNYKVTITKELSVEHHDIFRKAISAGTLVEGDVKIPPVDKDKAVLEEYWHLIKTYGLSPTDNKSKSTPAFRKLLRIGEDRGWTAKEIAKYCMAREKESKNRENIIRLLKELHRNSECPETFSEDD